MSSEELKAVEERARLLALHELNETGCSFGKVNRTNIGTTKEDVCRIEQRLDAINTKVWAVLLGIILQLVGALLYVMTHPTTIKAFWNGG